MLDSPRPRSMIRLLRIPHLPTHPSIHVPVLNHIQRSHYRPIDLASFSLERTSSGGEGVDGFASFIEDVLVDSVDFRDMERDEVGDELVVGGLGLLGDHVKGWEGGREG